MTATLEDGSPTPDGALLEGDPGSSTSAMALIAAALEAGLRARAPALDPSTPLVRKLAVRVSQQLGLDEHEQLLVDACAQLQDVGMIGLPDSVILNTGSLSPEDWALMNTHPDRSAELLQSVPGMAAVAERVRAHHERWDGEGIQMACAPKPIPLASRIVAACDAFVSIATGRPYRRGAVVFPWQTSIDALLLQSRIHAQAVARSTDRLAKLLARFERDELVAAALLHDIGKLLLARIWPGFPDAIRARHTPQEAVKLERRVRGYDHASPGRPDDHEMGSFGTGRDVDIHSSQRSQATDTEALVRLADMVVHHAHGDPVDRQIMLRLTTACGLPATALRDLLVDLPHSGGSARRRAKGSPLSDRETAILQLLGDGNRTA